MAVFHQSLFVVSLVIFFAYSLAYHNPHHHHYTGKPKSFERYIPFVDGTHFHQGGFGIFHHGRPSDLAGSTAVPDVYSQVSNYAGNNGEVEGYHSDAYASKAYNDQADEVHVDNGQRDKGAYDDQANKANVDNGQGVGQFYDTKAVVNTPQNTMNPGKLIPEGEARGYEVADYGTWEMASLNSGVSAMHIQLLPTNKILLYDSLYQHVSKIKLLPGEKCLPFVDPRKRQQMDCFAHTVEFDIETKATRPIKVDLEPWCSNGGIFANGKYLSSGGFQNGVKATRTYKLCPTCGWEEIGDVLGDERWYASQATLPNGDFIVLGGRMVYSYEFIPQETGVPREKPFFFPFLSETADVEENNLYPFIHLSTDGNLFVFSNNRSVLLNPTTHKIVRTFPVLSGGSRNYPASAMSALLPIRLSPQNIPSMPEILICGGARPESFRIAERDPRRLNLLPALRDCGRMKLTDPRPKWEKEVMPSGRVMGDMLILPTGDLLLINGAQKGTAGWIDADQPNLTPLLYSYTRLNGQRFKQLRPTGIARMYHSTSAVLPNGKIWVGGSNTNPTYDYKAKFPTETRIEYFSPPYLNASLHNYRPEIVVADASAQKLRYAQEFVAKFKLINRDVIKQDIEVTMYSVPFTTHGNSMNQRLLFLSVTQVSQTGLGVYEVKYKSPPSNVVAPPGFYLLFVLNRRIPSKGVWVNIQ